MRKTYRDISDKQLGEKVRKLVSAAHAHRDLYWVHKDELAELLELHRPTP